MASGHLLFLALLCRGVESCKAVNDIRTCTCTRTFVEKSIGRAQALASPEEALSLLTDMANR